MFKLDRALWKLTDLAKETKVDHIFDQADKAEDVERMMNESSLGQVWWSQLQNLLEKFGRRSTAAVLGFYYKTWIEDPYPVLSTIKTYIQKGGFDFEEHSKKLIEEREKSIKKTIASIPADQRDEVFFLTITRGVRVTEHIKTGDRVRIDGTNGVVEVLKPAGPGIVKTIIDKLRS